MVYKSHFLLDCESVENQDFVLLCLTIPSKQLRASTSTSLLQSRHISRFTKMVEEFQVTIKTHLASGKGEEKRDGSFFICGTTNVANKSSPLWWILTSHGGHVGFGTWVDFRSMQRNISLRMTEKSGHHTPVTTCTPSAFSTEKI